MRKKRVKMREGGLKGKPCLKLLANVPPEVADKDKWKDMLDNFNKIVKIGERITIDKTLH